MTQHGAGDGTGTSFSNAKAWADVRTQVQPDTIYCFDGDIYGGMPVEVSGLENVVFDGAQGPTGRTRFRNDLRIDTAELEIGPGGLFWFPAERRPPSIVWDYRQDDDAGSATGITFRDEEIATAFEGRPVRVPERFAPWFGHLHPVEGVPVEFLGPGEWSYVNGHVYVRPPAPVDTNAFVRRARVLGWNRGVYFKTSSGISIRNIDFVGFANQGNQTGAVYTSGCTDVVVENVIAYDSGYRAFNFDGNTGNTAPLRITMIECVAAGDTRIAPFGTSNPIVVYNRSGCADCQVEIVGGGIASYPWLDTDGRPLVGDPAGVETPIASEYRPAGFYTHSGLFAVGMAGFRFREFFVVSFCQMLNEHHGLTMVWPSETIGRVISNELPEPVVGTDPDTYPARFEDCVFVCSPGAAQHIVFDRCRFKTPRPRGRLDGYAGRISSWFAAPESNTSLYLRSCEIVLEGLEASPNFGLFQLHSGENTLCLDLCTVLEIARSDGFRVDSTIRSVGGATVRLRGCLFVTTSPNGWNQHFVYRPVGAAVVEDYDPVAWSGVEVVSCWFLNYSGDRFAERFGSEEFAGATFAEFLSANTAGGASQDFVTGEHVWDIDPLLIAPESGQVSPSEHSPVFTIDHPAIEDLAGELDFNGNPYHARFGAWQVFPESCPGDANADGDIDLADLNIVLANFGNETDEGDLDDDGQVDLTDLNIVLAAFGSSCSD